MNKNFNYLTIASCFILGMTLAYADSDPQGNMHDQMFKDIDANSNKMVTREEFNAFGEKKFQQMDTNGDGQLSPEEMKVAHKKMMSGESKQRDGKEMDASSKAHPQKDSVKPKSDTMDASHSNDSCCWTPRD